MSRAFNGSSDFWSIASAIVGSVPFTGFVRFYTNSNTADQTFFRQTGVAANARYLNYGGNVANDPVQFTSLDSVNNDVIAQNTAPLATATWHTLIGRAAGDLTTRSMRFNGSQTSGSGGVVNTANTAMEIGRFSSGGNYVNGRMASLAIWNASLPDSLCESLEKGFSPLRIQPQSLQLYIPMVRDIKDMMRGVAITVTGSTVADHPRSYGF
jgi:hypothetical protein